MVHQIVIFTALVVGVICVLSVLVNWLVRDKLDCFSIVFVIIGALLIGLSIWREFNFRIPGLSIKVKTFKLSSSEIDRKIFRKSLLLDKPLLDEYSQRQMFSEKSRYLENWKIIEDRALSKISNQLGIELQRNVRLSSTKDTIEVDAVTPRDELTDIIFEVKWIRESSSFDRLITMVPNFMQTVYNYGEISEKSVHFELILVIPDEMVSESAKFDRLYTSMADSIKQYDVTIFTYSQLQLSLNEY